MMFMCVFTTRAYKNHAYSAAVTTQEESVRGGIAQDESSVSNKRQIHDTCMNNTRQLGSCAGATQQS